MTSHILTTTFFSTHPERSVSLVNTYTEILQVKNKMTDFFSVSDNDFGFRNTEIQ